MMHLLQPSRQHKAKNKGGKRKGRKKLTFESQVIGSNWTQRYHPDSTIPLTPEDALECKISWVEKVLMSSPLYGIVCGGLSCKFWMLLFLPVFSNIPIKHYTVYCTFILVLSHTVLLSIDDQYHIPGRCHCVRNFP